MQEKTIKGFSKLSKEEKLDWVSSFFEGATEVKSDFQLFWQTDSALQKTLDGFSENTISNYVLPYGVAPNFLIDGEHYTIPMVIEESSVVAAASSAAKYWLSRGGFHTEIVDVIKLGQVHFLWPGNINTLKAVLPELEKAMRKDAAEITANMEKRGGGIDGIELKDFSAEEPDYYQFLVRFTTCDSMGANFINSVLESFAKTLKIFFATHSAFEEKERDVNIIMAILSNYTPECLVRAWVECDIKDVGYDGGDYPSDYFAKKFYTAVRIARIDPYRATTHNKGIMNGIDAVVLATGNDFRAIEASCHTHAARDGKYRSLSTCSIEDSRFKFSLEVPLALGTVGGLTKLHPLAKRSLEMLGNPSAETLMRIVAAMGLAQNFAAVRSLVTTGIQQGHMKMHLQNILNHFNATSSEAELAVKFFEKNTVSFVAVRHFLENLRSSVVKQSA
ncbi:MAG: hydroxymethylglutaryl-CoA reductase, degradative [Bacteroidota bacterium]